MIAGEKRIRPNMKGKGPMESPLAFDEAAEEGRILAFIRRTVKAAQADGVVVGLSGGVDSSVVCALCAKALGRGKVLGILLPSDSTPAGDVADAKALATSLGVETKEVRIDRISREILSNTQIAGSKLARANVQARLRMTVLYFYANTLGRLVVGTGDRSESLIGFFTKHGDGGVDFLPIAHLYKTQVRSLGGRLGLPRKIVNKPSSPQLWPGHKATDEIPADYDKLDLVLHFLFDKRLSPEEAAERAGVDPSVAARVVEMNARSAHKRALPVAMARPEKHS